MTDFHQMSSRRSLPNRVFGKSSNFAWYSTTHPHSLYNNTVDAKPTEVLSGASVGKMLDLSGNAYNASQATGTARPTLIQVNGQYGLRSDFVDDYVAMPGGFTGGKAAIKTPYGHYFGSMDSASRLPLNDASEVIVADAMTTAQKTAISNYFGSGEKTLVLVNPTTVFDNVIFYTVAGSADVIFTGANGATYTKSYTLLAPELVDVADFGLTAPVAAAFEKRTDLVALFTGADTMTGSMPDVSDCGSLQYLQLTGNPITGSIGVLENNPALEYFEVNNCQITDFTGGVPSSLSYFSATNNLLTATAVNAVLAAFVASGTTTAMIDLGGTGNAAPTGQGITDKNTLLSRGCTVTTN